MGFVGITNYKKNSERLPGKHHMEFYNGKTLVDIKLEQLFAAGAEHVIVSTDDEDAYSDNDELLTYIYRDPKWCNNITEWSSVLGEIFNSTPISDDTDIIYTFTCCPMFKRYDELFARYKETGNNQIVVMPSSHYWLDKNKRPVNFNFGLWHTYSQGIDPIYLFPYAGTACKIGDLRKVNYMIPQTYDYFEIDQFESIDIDTKAEFEMAQQLYRATNE